MVPALRVGTHVVAAPTPGNEHELLSGLPVLRLTHGFGNGNLEFTRQGSSQSRWWSFLYL